MHHFLPTDWSDYIKDKERARSKADLNIPEDQDIDILRYSSELNPTNIWLAEELIRSMILNTSAKIDKDKSDDPEYLEDIYAKPIEKLKYLSEGEQRNFGILLIQGLMDGECLRFSRERERYREAKNFKSQSPLLNWYLGYSYSNEVYFRIGGYSCESEEKETKIGLMQLNDLDDDCKKFVEKAKKYLEMARDETPWAAWIGFTYGCELVQWPEDDKEKERGVAEILRVADLLSDVIVEMDKEVYMEKVREHPKIKQKASSLSGG